MWTVEGVKGKRYGCFARAKGAAIKLARDRRRPVRVTYHGHRSKTNNRNLATANFAVHPNGRIDPTIDPSWYTNHTRK